MPTFLSKVQYDTVSGFVGPYTFDKGYLSKSHVKAYVDGVEVSFSWVTDSSVNLDVDPGEDDLVLIIQRETPSDELFVDFENAAILQENNLDNSTLQALYVAQEAVDDISGTLNLYLNSFDADNHKIVNLSPGTENGDAVAFEQISAYLTSVQAALTSAQAALASAETARDAALAAQSAAETAATNAAQYDFEEHTHEIEDTTGLQDALDLKASTSLVNTKADQTDLDDAITDISKSVRFDSQTLTPAQQEQARDNIRASSSFWEVIDEVDISSQVVSTDHVGLGSFSRIRVTFKLKPTTDDAALWLRFSDDAGVTFEDDTGDYKWAITYVSSGSSDTSTSDNSATKIILSTGVGNQSSEYISGVIEFIDFGQAESTSVRGHLTYSSYTGTHYGAIANGKFNAQTVLNGFQLFFDSGNIDLGYVKIEGISG